MEVQRADVVIVGGAAMGSAVAWFLRASFGFDGTVVVVERDFSWQTAGTSLTNSCLRQQFSEPINVEISQYAAAFVADFDNQVGDGVGPLFTDYFGYLYLAGDDVSAAAFRSRREMQNRLGAYTEWLDRQALAERFPSLCCDDLVGGSFNPVDEGYFDSGSMVDRLRRAAKRAGAVWIDDTVVDFSMMDGAVRQVVLASGRRIEARHVVNAAGTRASTIAAMAGVELPVEPRKRFTYVIDTADSPGRLPLTIDPSGVHVRSDGAMYMAGAAPKVDDAVDPDDFSMDDDPFEETVWPTLAARVPAFERLKVLRRWAGHYAYNTFDQNAIVGLHPAVGNLYFCNGFSGHGMQQAPAMGRGIAELICFGEYRSLDLSPLGFARILANRPLSERAVI